MTDRGPPPTLSRRRAPGRSVAWQAAPPPMIKPRGRPAATGGGRREGLRRRESAAGRVAEGGRGGSPYSAGRAAPCSAAPEGGGRRPSARVVGVKEKANSRVNGSYEGVGRTEEFWEVCEWN